MNKNATIVALAWPDTKVVKEGKWYDIPMKWLGFLKDGYYNAGHAAFLLIHHQTKEIHYFDFGRYHTPYQYGRVRDSYTDPNLKLKLKAEIVDGEIINIEDILLERFQNKSCHGEGRLTAALVKNVCFESAYYKVKQLQSKEAIPYGPFAINGSTCSRLVVQIVSASVENKLTKLLIRLPYTISATPRSNNKVLNDYPYYLQVDNGKVEYYPNKWYWLKRLGLKKPIKQSSSQSFIPKTA